MSEEPERVKARGKGTHPLYDDIEALQKLYGDKSEQYVAERLAHEATRTQLSQALRERDEAEKRCAGHVTGFDQLCQLYRSCQSERDQALRELGEARDMLKRAIDRENRLQDELDVALRSTAELRGALERLVADYEDVPDATDAEAQSVFERARTALASSSTKET